MKKGKEMNSESGAILFGMIIGSCIMAFLFAIFTTSINDVVGGKTFVLNDSIYQCKLIHKAGQE